MYYDMHTHSHFSTDSRTTIYELIDSALLQNLSGIAFTDHFDIDFKDEEDMYHFDFNQYFKTVSECIDKYKEKLTIIKAIEIGLQPHTMEETKKKIAGFNFDYIIASTHLINRRDPYLKDIYFDTSKSQQSVYREYLETVDRNMHIWQNYDTLGHWDYLVRNSIYEDNTMYYNLYSDIIDDILQYLAYTGRALEINTSTYEKCPFDIKVLKRFKEFGGENIVLGSDAHFKNSVAKFFPVCSQIIKDCGFNYLTYYIDRKPLHEKI